jgi:hypothetical protein
MRPPKIRTCGECKQKFGNPESFRLHKYKFGTCRTPEALRAVGFIETANGWKMKKASGVA